MEYLLSIDGLRDLMKLLLICVALVIGCAYFFRYCARTDEIWKLDHPLDTDEPSISDVKPKRYPVNPDNAANLLAAMQSLRTDLPQHKNQTPPAADFSHEAETQRQMMADTLRGTKL